MWANKKQNNSLFVIIWLVVLFVVGIGAFYLMNQSEEELEEWEYRIVWKAMSAEGFNTGIIDATGSLDFVNMDTDIPIWDQQLSEAKIDYNKIVSMIRAVCVFWNDTEKLLWLTTFQLVKDEIDTIKNKQKNTDKFIFIDLPWMVYEACPANDPNYLQRLIKYLQVEWSGNMQQDKIDVEKYNKFLDEIVFDSTGIDTARIKSDRDYFNKVILEDNLTPIKSAYFSEYVSRKDNPTNFFFTTSVLSITEINEILEKTITQFEDFLKEIWFRNLQDFRKALLKNNWYTDLDWLKATMKQDYYDLQELVLEKYGLNLNEAFITIEWTANFHQNKFEEITQSNDVLNLFNKMWREYIIYSIVSDDFADGLDEIWSAKEQFGDNVAGNGIIKIWFIYLFESDK